MTEEEFQDMFKFYHVIDRMPTAPADGSHLHAARRTSSSSRSSPSTRRRPRRRRDTRTTSPRPAATSRRPAVRTASRTRGGPNGVSARARRRSRRGGSSRGRCYWKVDMSFVKRIRCRRTCRVEARMDLFNVFNTINFNATTRDGQPAFTNWQVTSAATDLNASQDPGGRITSFGLRVTW